MANRTVTLAGKNDWQKFSSFANIAVWYSIQMNDRLGQLCVPEILKSFQWISQFKIFISPNNEMYCVLYQSNEILTSQILRTGRFQEHCVRQATNSIFQTVR
jgi:hypothetical protein